MDIPLMTLILIIDISDCLGLLRDQPKVFVDENCRKLRGSSFSDQVAGRPSCELSDE